MGNLQPNLVYASPTSGIGPLSPRKLVLSDLPSLPPGGISSISCTDGSLLLTPDPIITTGTVAINTYNVNQWEGQQNFDNISLQNGSYCLFNGVSDTNWGMGLYPFFTCTNIGSSSSIQVSVGQGTSGPDGFAIGQCCAGSSIAEFRGYDKASFFNGATYVNCNVPYGNFTVAGGIEFTDIPGYGIVSIGDIVSTVGWNGAGLLMGNSTSGETACSIVYNEDQLFFGQLTSSISNILGTWNQYVFAVGTNVSSNAFVTNGGTSSQFVKGDGSLDSTSYGTGTVTSVIANAPLTGGTITTSGSIGINKADAATDGYLSATDFGIFHNKQNAITTGTVAQYFRGDLSLATFPSGLPPTGSAGGDLSGTYPNPTVHQILGKSIASLTSGFLKYNGTSWIFDTNTYLTGNQTVTLSGDATGAGATSIGITLATVNSNVGTFNTVTVNGKGLVTAASNTSYQSPISLTTTGSSGSATFVSNTLNVPTYTLAGLGGISLSALSASSPLSYNNTTGAFSINKANTSTDGYISSTDWNTFNGKQPQLSGTGFVKASGTSITYDNSTYLTGNQSITLSGDVTGTGATSISTSISATTVTGKALTGYLSGAGTISSSDSILSAIQKLNGNIAAIPSGVSSVSNSDSTLTISPTTGAVIASLNLANANTWTGAQTLQQNSIGTSVTPAITLTNTTAATSGNPQYSPALYFHGANWYTTGSASQPQDWRIYVNTQSNANPFSSLSFGQNNNGTGWTEIMNLQRSAITLEQPVTVTANNTTSAFTVNYGMTIGGRLNITTGSNHSAGTATLSSGTVTISNTLVTASSLVFVQYQAGGTLSGASATMGLRVSTVTAGTSFVIVAETSPGTKNTLDNSPVQWWFIN